MNMFKKKNQPRKLDEITAEYSRVAFQAGQANYQAKVYQNEVEKHNKRMYELNLEADRRKQLDNAEAAKQAEDSKSKGTGKTAEGGK